MIKPTRQKTKLTRAPRADKLNLSRDILHLLSRNEGVMTLKRLFNATRAEFSPPKADIWQQETFNEYIVFLKRLELARVSRPIIRILDRGKTIVGCSDYGQEELGAFEKQIFKSLLLAYNPFKDFLSVSFCEGQSFHKERELFEKSKCPKRKDVLEAYLNAHGQKDDREVRTMLYWGIQVGLIEFDEYHNRFFLVNPRKLGQDSFIDELFKAYNKSQDFKTGLALIPEVRFLTCCSLKISKTIFDNNLIRQFKSQPSIIELGKASTSRIEVQKYGVTDKKSYYYYIRINKREKNAKGY